MERFSFLQILKLKVLTVDIEIEQLGLWVSNTQVPRAENSCIGYSLSWFLNLCVNYRHFWLKAKSSLFSVSGLPVTANQHSRIEFYTLSRMKTEDWINLEINKKRKFRIDLDIHRSSVQRSSDYLKIIKNYKNINWIKYVPGI